MADAKRNGAVPNAVPASQEAAQVKDLLARAQQAHLQIELVQVANDHQDTDVIPGEPPRSGPDGHYLYENDKPVYPTYGERYAELDAQIARLVERAEARPGVMTLVAKLVAAQEAESDAEVAAAEADAAER